MKRMKKFCLVIIGAAALAGCAHAPPASPTVIGQSQDDRICRAVAAQSNLGISYQNCFAARQQSRARGENPDPAPVYVPNNLGPALQDAGRALQSINPPLPMPAPQPLPMPQTTHCNFIGRQMICNSF
jgi:hypothetical protein